VTGFSRWVKGQAQGLEPGAFKRGVNWIQLVQPHHGPPPGVRSVNVVNGRRSVAVQVECERQTLKPVVHFTSSRVETRRFQAMGQLDSTLYSPTTAPWG
jgi:hypothetical protein